MVKGKLSDDEWKQLCNHFLSELAKSATHGRGSVQKAADAIGVRKQRISAMRSYDAVGDKTSWIRMICYKAGLSDQEAKNILSNPNIVITTIDSPSPVDEMYESLKKLYSKNELAGWFKLLLSKRKIEKDFKVSLSALDTDPQLRKPKRKTNTKKTSSKGPRKKTR